MQVAAAEKKDEMLDLTEQVALRVNQEREKLTRRLNKIAHELSKVCEILYRNDISFANLYYI